MIQILSSDLEGDAEKVVEIELKSRRSIFVIPVEDIIIHRLESVLVSSVQFPEDYEDYQWAYRMILLHKSDLIDYEYLKQTHINGFKLEYNLKHKFFFFLIIISLLEF